MAAGQPVSWTGGALPPSPLRATLTPAQRRGAPATGLFFPTPSPRHPVAAACVPHYPLPAHSVSAPAARLSVGRHPRLPAPPVSRGFLLVFFYGGAVFFSSFFVSRPACQPPPPTSHTTPLGACDRRASRRSGWRRRLGSPPPPPSPTACLHGRAPGGGRNPPAPPPPLPPARVTRTPRHAPRHPPPSPPYHQRPPSRGSALLVARRRVHWYHPPVRLPGPVNVRLPSSPTSRHPRVDVIASPPPTLPASSCLCPRFHHPPSPLAA